MLASGVVSGQRRIKAKELFMMTIEELMNLNVTGVSRYGEPISSAPASIVVITEQQIIERGYEDLSDLLRDIPGIDIVENARGFGEFYTIRGIEGNDRFLVLIDGEKINPVSGTFVSIGNSISVRFAKRIEVIFGPASAIYGADGFSGIINIVSKDVDSKPSLTSRLSYGSMRSRDLLTEGGVKIGSDFSLYGLVRFFNSDGPNFMGLDSVYNIIKSYPPPARKKFEQPIHDHTIFLKARWRDLSLSYFRQRFDEGNSLGLPPDSYIYNKEARWKYTTDLVQTHFRKKFGLSNLLSIDLAYIQRVQDPETRFYKWKSALNFNDIYSQYMTGRDRTFRAVIGYSSRLFNESNIITAVEYEDTRSIPPYANDQVLGNSYKYEGENAKKIDRALTIRERRYGCFAQIEYDLSEKIDIVLGGRYDYSTRYKGTFNPRSGIIIRPNSKSVLKLIYGTAFQAPSLFYQYEQWGSPTAVMLSVDEIRKDQPKWGLRNQRVKTLEATLSYQIASSVGCDLSVYNSILTDVIKRVMYSDSSFNKYFSTEDTVVYSQGFRNENIGKQRITGLNLSLYVELISKVSGYFHYSYTDGIEDEKNSNSDIPRIARNKVLIGFTFRDLFNFLTVTPRFRWIGSINNRNRALFPDGRQPGYTSFDLFITTKRVLNCCRIYARVENLFNSNIRCGGLYDQTFYLPEIQQPGITAMLGVEIGL